MKKLEKELKGHKHIVFLDFEATQFTSEMIAIGAVSSVLDKHGRIKSSKAPITIYVKAKNKIGKFVTDLTGITEEMIKEKGISFASAMKALKKYVGHSFDKASFITYNNHDMRILGQSIAYNFDFPKDICSQIQKNYLDFEAFIDEFVRDANGNSLSLVHSCELFGVKLAEPAHDPANDAVNLANLFDAFVAHPEIIKEEYKKCLSLTNKHLAVPIQKTIQAIVSGKSVSPEEFDTFIEDYLK